MMAISRLTVRLLATLTLTVAAVALLGCGHKGATEVTAADVHAFDNAPGPLKQVWNAAMEASRTNDYAQAQTLFYGLLTAELTPQQKQAVSAASTDVNQRMLAGVDKGDPAALAALQKLHQNPPNRAR